MKSCRLILWLFTVYILGTNLVFARPYVHFYRLPTDDHIKFTNSFCVFQDSKEVVWVCTSNGLVKYNSSDVKIYRNIPGNINSIPSNLVRDIVEGPGNKLWIATINGGLVSLDTKTEVFRQHKGNISQQLWTLLLDKNKKTLWIGGLNSGLTSFNLKSKKIVNYNLIYPDGKPLSRVNTIFQKGDTYLLGTNRGLYRFIAGERELIPVLDPDLVNNVNAIKIINDKGIWVASENGVFTLTGNPIVNTKIADDVNSIETDHSGNIYLSTTDKGLIIIHHETGQIKYLTHLVSDKNSLPDNFIWDIEVTKDNMVMVATKAGIGMFNPAALQYSYYDRIWLNKDHKRDLEAHSIFYDSKQNLWFGTNFGVIKYSTAEKEETVQYWETPHSVVYDFHEDQKGNIWVAEIGRGLSVFRTENPDKLVVLNPKNNHCCNIINSIEGDFDTGLWLGTNDSGLVKYLPKIHSYSDVSANNRPVTEIEHYNKSLLLLGTYSGLYYFKKNSSKYTLVKGTKNIFIFDVFQTKNGIFYIGTDKGLLRLKKVENSIIAHKIELFDDKVFVIFSIQEAINGDIWLGAGSALIRYRPKTGRAFALTQQHGMPALGFLRNSSAASNENSILFFGGVGGVVSFSPESIDINTSYPEVVINGIEYNKDDKKHYNFGKGPLNIPYPIKSLTINFHSIDYRTPTKEPQYRYLLEGFDDSLQRVQINRASYTNLAPGTYTFKIKAANSFGEWGTTFTELTFTVLTPWWMSWWAYLLYTIIALAILGLLFWYQHRRLLKERSITSQLREAENLREHFVQELEEQVSSATHDLRDSMEALQIKTVELEVANKRAQDSTHLKSQFLANISHELRTPLNGILGFVNLLTRTRMEAKQHEYVSTIRQSGESLMDIINNVLDISKIEAGKITLDTTRFNLRDCIEGTLALLAPIAYEKKLELCCIIEPDLPLQLRGDPARLRQILTNLLGNAIKFTQNGTVSLRVLAASHQAVNENDNRISLTIAISDTGIGIAPDHLERLFTSFNQATPGIERRFGGTGLGLSLSKMLVEAMQGTIKLQSTPDVGTTVRIDISLDQDNNPPDWQVDKNLAKHTVLLYDEHPLCAQGLVFLLQSWGMQVIETSNYDEWQTELAKHTRQPRYAAFIASLTAQQISKSKTVIKKLRGKQTNLPLLILASTLDLDTLYNLETALGTPCLAKHVGSQMIHNTLLALLDDQPQFSRTARKLNTNKQLSGLRILIADDNSANRELLRHMLRQNGAHTEEVTDGRETLQRLHAMDASNEPDNKPWDILLLDIHMPNVSGLEVIARIREGKAGAANLPVIAVTANAMSEMQQWAKACGMDGYIVKPFTEEKLLEEIQRVLPVKNEEERQ